MTKRNHANDVAAMAKLTGYQPDQLAGFRVGDLVDMPTLGRCEVVELLPPSLLKLRKADGGQFKAGWRACQRVRQ